MQTTLNFRTLHDITDEELRDVCLLSGETSMTPIIEGIERVKDEDGRIRSINVTCRNVNQDGSFGLNQICMNPEGIVWCVNLQREACSNPCRRDVIANQMEVLFYLMLKGFDFSIHQATAQLFITDHEKWRTGVTSF